MSDTSPERVLIADDEEAVRRTIGEVLRYAGYEVVEAEGGTQALEKARTQACAAAIVDLNMPGMSGMEVVRGLKEMDPDAQVIIYTGYPSVETSIEAIHEQVFDYICKPAHLRTVEQAVRRAVERRHLIQQNRALMQELEQERDRLQKQVDAAKRAIRHRFEESRTLVGRSEPIEQVRRFMAEVAPSDMTVLLLGESGAGKDVVARLIHESSGRNPQVFVKINCPTIPDTLLESELFGHEAGAFTGAERRKPGRFELGEGGTVFLDEIGDLPMDLQAKLLQVIEQKQFNRLGGGKTISVDVRIIAATNADLRAMIADGKFRADLFYRLNDYAIELPPLRSRTEDIPSLVDHFLQLYGSKYGNSDLRITPETMSIMIQYDWPGNVRELESVIRRFTLDGDENTIRKSLSAPAAPSLGTGRRAADIVRDTEIQTIMAALTEHRWNQRAAAASLGMSYSSLRRRVAKYGLKEQSKRSGETSPSGLRSPAPNRLGQR